jgi:hypothetical protein
MYASRTSLASDRGTAVLSRTLGLDALHWTLRVGAFLCFVGHGAFGIMTKQAWLPYFAVAHIGPATAYSLMPVIGAIDFAMGCLVLFSPRPAVVYWMTLWAVWTALLRPLAGESGWEALERAGNYGVPLALILLAAPSRGVVSFFAPISLRQLTERLLRNLEIVLVAVVVLLLVGHGALGVEGKPGLVSNYASIFPDGVAARMTPIVGGGEIVLALVLARWPSVRLALFIAVWKLAIESLFLAAGAPLWEIVERGGSYAAPVALAIVLMLTARRRARPGSEGTASPDVRSRLTTPTSTR